MRACCWFGLAVYVVVEPNALESERFGVVAAGVRDPDASPQALNSAAEALGVQMLVVRIHCHDHSRIHTLEADGFRLMDTIVHYERSLSELPPPSSQSGDVTIRRARPQDASAVADVARAAFSNYIGHYHADPRLQPAAADAAYVEWAEGSVGRQSETEEAIVLFCAERLGGFLTLRRSSPADIEIVLNAVHPDLQRRGLYERLLAEAMVRGQKSGADRITVSTQVNNFPVQRAWATLGFRLVRSQHTFHKWYF